MHRVRARAENRGRDVHYYGIAVFLVYALFYERRRKRGHGFSSSLI